jgi:hypothetical protein
MIEKLKKTISGAGDVIKEQASNLSDAVKEQANNLSDAVKEKTYALIEDWLKIFPNLEGYGFKVTSFGLCMALSPALDVELTGNANAFNIDKLNTIIEENKGNQALTTVFKAIKTAFEWHERTGSDRHFKVVLLKLSIKITPEVKVYLGQPLLT